ncbi:hypothetical protein [Oceanibium sediminis]|uniref:hypothetical protein n=1 Tax=Oceanibium sediminis TaxID=2026339 RepID=UPI000DD3990E|nr:hypothetical protein [Oceanibium sediminis]
MAATQSSKQSANGEVTVHELSEQIDQLKTEIGELTANIGRYSRQQGEHQLEAVQSAVKALPDEAANVVRERPVAALGLALGLGVIVGMMTGRR